MHKKFRDLELDMIDQLEHRIEILEERIEWYKEGLNTIAYNRPVQEFNPDGEDQAAHTMQFLAREYLKRYDS
jgi:hypothetical protein